MSNTNTWLQETIEALEELNQESSLKEICQQIKKRNKLDLSSKNWSSTVSHYIQRNCRGYSIYSGDSPLFEKVTIGMRVKFRLIDFKDYSIPEVLLDYESNWVLEGKEKFLQHWIHERNPKIIAIAKDIFKSNHNNKLFCEVCGFNFEEKYGEHGKDFIEGHHTFPISQMEANHKTTPEEIVMVCSNCHRMLHRRRPWITKSDLKNLLIL